MQNIRLVMKFGGTSVQNYEAMRQVSQIVKENRAKEMLIVTSALSGITDMLLSIGRAVQNQDRETITNRLQEIEERHLDILNTLERHGQNIAAEEAQLESFFTALEKETEELLVRDKFTLPDQDHLASYGERLSSVLLTAVLKENDLPATWFDVTRVMKTDDNFTKAMPLMPRVRHTAKQQLLPMLKNNQVTVTQGFIGLGISGKITTLGRGGSDYSASILGAAINAGRVEIWTDVDGVMSADPRLVPNARTLDYMSFTEASELAYFGAKVLHPATLLPSVKDAIPVTVRNTEKPSASGTTILKEVPEDDPYNVRSIACKRGITIINITSHRMLMAYGFLDRVFSIFNKFKTPVDLVTTSEVSVSMTIDDVTHLKEIRAELEKIGEVEMLPNQAIICLVGQKLQQSTAIAARAFTAIQPVNPHLISRGASKVNLSFTVAETDVAETVGRLHAEFIEKREVSLL